MTDTVLRYLVIGFVAAATASGQAALFVFARRLDHALPWPRLAGNAVADPYLWLGLLSYGTGVIGYVVALKLFGLAQATLTLMALIVLFNLGYNQWLGQPLGALQWLGVGLLVGGLALLHAGG